MRVTIGSKNQAKIGAVTEVIKDYDFLADAEIISSDVDSGVPEQPFHFETIVQGAINRANNAFKDCDLSFGIEDGLVKIPKSKSGYMTFSVCAIFDGKCHHLGVSSGFEFPLPVMKYVLEQGLDASEAYKKAGLTTKEKIGAHEGAVGHLTKGRVPRKDYTKPAIINALMHLENPELF